MKSKYPNFHKKNIIKRQEIQTEENIEINQPEVVENSPKTLDYPQILLSTKYEGENYEELGVAVEFYNVERYENALKVFESRPADPARAFKNTICAFHGPIGWLLMYNTKYKKDAFIRFCKACCYYRLGKFSTALDLIKNDNTIRPVYLKAWCQYKLGYHREAKETFKKAIHLNPKYLTMDNPYQDSEII